VRTPAPAHRLTTQALLHLSHERVDYELRCARAAGQAYRRGVVRDRWLLTASIVELLAGWALIALAFHVQGEDAGQALFFGGLLVGYLGPVWTWLLSRWRGGEGV
jgi:hypothetical protein